MCIEILFVSFWKKLFLIFQTNISMKPSKYTFFEECYAIELSVIFCWLYDLNL